MPNPRTDLTAEQRQLVIDLYAKLKHTTLVQEQTGFSYGRIVHTLKRAGIPRRPGGRIGVCHRNHDLVARLAKNGTALAAIARRLGTNTKTVRRYICEHGLDWKRWTSHGKNNYFWHGGRRVEQPECYLLLSKPEHPMADSHGYVRAHRLVMEKKLGRLLTRKEVVHHIDDDPTNNHHTTLRLYSSNGEHLRDTQSGPNHWTKRRRKTSRKA